MGRGLWLCTTKPILADLWCKTQTRCADRGGSEVGLNPKVTRSRYNRGMSDAIVDKPDGKRRKLIYAMWIAVAAGIYVDAYYATVFPPRGVICGPGPWHSYRINGYRLPRQSYTFFAPIHWVDRKIRPQTWWTPSDE